MRSAISVRDFGSMGVNSHGGSGLETAIFGPAFRTMASSRGGSLLYRRRLCLSGFMVGPCFDSSGPFVSGRICWKLQEA